MRQTPTDRERALAESLFQNALRDRANQSATANADPMTKQMADQMAFADVCQVLFCFNEFLYVD